MKIEITANLDEFLRWMEQRNERMDSEEKESKRNKGTEWQQETCDCCGSPFLTKFLCCYSVSHSIPSTEDAKLI